MEPVNSVAVYGYGNIWLRKQTHVTKNWGKFLIRQQQHMGKQQETELFRKCPENSLKIHSFDFRNGMYGTSLEHRESINVTHF